MTTVPDAPVVRFDDLDEALAVLRRAGCRASAARRVVLEALFAAAGPVSAEGIADGLGGRVTRSDLASTYRNLETLEAHGLVRHVHLGHGPGLWALAGCGEQEYLLCDRCGEVRALDPRELDPMREEIRRAFGFRARFSHFPILGLCARCAAAPGAHEHAEDSHEHGHGDVTRAHPHAPEQGFEHRHDRAG